LRHDRRHVDDHAQQGAGLHLVVQCNVGKGATQIMQLTFRQLSRSNRRCLHAEWKAALSNFLLLDHFRSMRSQHPPPMTKQ
jgi:hypothetical protein